MLYIIAILSVTSRIMSKLMNISKAEILIMRLLKCTTWWQSKAEILIMRLLKCTTWWQKLTGVNNLLIVTQPQTLGLEPMTSGLQVQSTCHHKTVIEVITFSTADNRHLTCDVPGVPINCVHTNKLSKCVGWEKLTPPPAALSAQWHDSSGDWAHCADEHTGSGCDRIILNTSAQTVNQSNKNS